MKRKVILYMAVSLDGYITDKDGRTNWRNGESEFYQGDYGKSGFLSIVDTVIMGKNTYKKIMDKEGADNWPYKDMTTYVITHLPDEDTEAIKFVNTRMSTFLQKLLQEEGKDIWIYGGSDIANQVIILGGGERLFNDKNKEIKLHLVKNVAKNGVIDCLYEKQ